MRKPFVWISLVLSWIVLVGIVLQLYFIAAYIFGAGTGALHAHEDFGGAVVHPAEILVFLVSLVAWWRNWRNIGLSFLLALLGTAQVFLAGDVNKGTHGWLHGLHGGLVVFVVWIAWLVSHREMRALGIRLDRSSAAT
jgi:hypothetical protein